MADEKNQKVSSEETSTSQVQIQHLLKAVVDNNASDLHITVSSPPVMRVHGEIVKTKLPPLKREDTKRILMPLFRADQKKEFQEKLELDFSFEIRGLGRFRGNIYMAQGAMSGAFRYIPSIIPDFKSLNLPNTLLEMADTSNGLILITGPAGSGKTTTLASLVDQLNDRRNGHIVTLEDPIEFVHPHKTSIVNQREVGCDTHSFKDGLRSLLRQDPNIVLVGELRDMETIEAALTLAETGSLVFSTLHTNSAIQTINRIINVFPHEQQDQVRTLLSFVIQGVVSQKLVQKSFSSGRVMALEVLLPTPGIRNLIRGNKLHQVYSQMQIGQGETGMMTMNQSLYRLVEQGSIDKGRALANTTMPDELVKMLEDEEKSIKSA